MKAPLPLPLVKSRPPVVNFERVGMPNTNRWGSAEVEKNYNWAMRRYLFIVALTTIFGLATGAGFALFNDSSPKYYPLDLIEYENFLETAANLNLSLAESNRDSKIAEWVSAVEYCSPYRPKPI